MENQVLAVVRASVLRRALGLSMLGGLGALLICIAVFRPPPSPGWQVFLLGLGVVALWGMERMRRGGAGGCCGEDAIPSAIQLTPPAAVPLAAASSCCGTTPAASASATPAPVAAGSSCCGEGPAAEAPPMGCGCGS